MLLLSLLSLFGAITYKLYSLNNWGVLITLILSLATFITIQRAKKRSNLEPPPSFSKEGLRVVSHPSRQNDKKSYFSFYSYFLLLTFNFLLLTFSRVSGSIISPWQVIPWYFFITYVAATILLIFIILKKAAPTKLILVALSCHYFLSFSVAWMIYKIGYGFDPFIHQATLELIDKNGAVDPKPFYYLGQYALEIITHKIFFIPIVWIDRLLVPLLAAIYLPAALCRALTQGLADQKEKLKEYNLRAVFLTIVLILILPFSFFIVTTPQNLAYLFLILIVLLSLSAKNKYDYALLGLLSLSTLTIQPIAGIPAVLFSSFTFLQQKIKSKKIIFSFSVFYFLILIFALPVAFYLFNGKAAISLDGIKNLFAGAGNLLPLIPKEENFILNFIYLYGFNLKFVLLILIVIGVYIRRRDVALQRLYLATSLALFLSWILINVIPFNFLIYYERDDYPERILTVAIIFLLPFILVVLQKFAEKIISAEVKTSCALGATMVGNSNSLTIKIPFLIFIVALITTSLYLSYPRFDNYFNSRGYSTGENDIKAVHWIDEKAGEDYIVLANQQVSAAALREFGFKKYHDAHPKIPSSDSQSKISNLKFKIFFYPVPTGEALYQYYLDMVYKKPSRETMLAAMDLAGVNKGYFILNKYWWAFPKILDEAKLSSSGWQSFGDGEVWVFEYVR
jgi:hypothetical protein